MNNQLDLLLINPASNREAYQSLSNHLAAKEPPIWAALFASFIRRRGFSVEILDAEAEDLSAEKTARRIIQKNPFLAAVVVYGHHPSASTQNMTASGKICSLLKQAGTSIKTILVGGHVAALSKRTLEEEAADFVCDGEGPYTLLDLLQALKSNFPEDLSQVRGLWYRAGDELCSNPPAPLVQNLDVAMPGPAWDLLPMERYRAHNWHCFGGLFRQPYAALYTTLGCPYHCSFCCIQAPFKSGEKVLGYKDRINSYRFWSPDFILSQIDTLVHQYGVQNIKIADEMFVLNAKHVEALCDRIIDRGYDLNIWAYARVDTIRENMLEKLKKAGFRWLAFGIEAGSERVRNQVEKSLDQELIFKTIRRVQESGISIIGNFIFGLPEDDRQSMQDTLDLALVLNCEFVNFYTTMAYPGSPLYEQALKEGWTLPETWEGYSQHAYNTLPLPTKYLSASEVLCFRDHAFQVYFSSPDYLRLVAEKFGVETLEHIRKMTQQRLERKYAGVTS